MKKLIVSLSAVFTVMMVFALVACEKAILTEDTDTSGDKNGNLTVRVFQIEQTPFDSLRDWGYAKDYVECMWLILQNKEPEDFVIATGVQHSVREFTDLAFRHAGIELKFEGEGINEKGICVKGPEKLIGKTLVAVSEDFYRPTDVVNLWGDPTKAKAKLGWNPAKTSFEELVKLMVEHDIAKVAAEGAAAKVRTNLAEYLEKGIVK